MTDYIINPMWFYWLHVVDMLQGFCFIMLFLLGVAFVVCAIVYIILNVDMDFNYDECKALTKYLKSFSVAIIIIALIMIFIPSKQTLIEMEIAKHATYSNVESIKEQITDAADYIIDRLKGEKE